MINFSLITRPGKDAGYVDKLRERLIGGGVNVWLDRHDIVAGTIQRQLWRAIQVRHIGSGGPLLHRAG